MKYLKWIHHNYFSNIFVLKNDEKINIKTLFVKIILEHLV